MKAKDRKRFSELADMLCVHIAFGRTSKALLIAQALRRKFGFCMVSDLNVETGYRGDPE